MDSKSDRALEIGRRAKSRGYQNRLISSPIGQWSPIWLLIMTVIPIFITGFLLMFVLNDLSGLPKSAEAIIDACALAILGFPAPYLLLFRPLVSEMARLRQAEKNLRIQASAINATTDQVVITDLHGNIRFVNPAFEKETGYSFQEVVGQNPRILKSSKHSDDFYKDLWSTIYSGKTWQGEITNRRRDGSIYTEDTAITPVANEAGEIENYIAIKRNITEKKKVRQRMLDHLAYHDPLTGLPNRLMFSHRLTQSLARAKRHSHRLAVMFMDLDRFKLINDTLGHRLGDLLLEEAAKRLTCSLDGVGTIARMGGDEFTAILTGIDSADDADKIARRALDAIAVPFTLEGREIFVTASIGISMYPTHGLNAETLVKNADSAMYKAKEQGKNTYCLYTDSLNDAAMRRMTLESELRKALERDELIVYYQPVVRLGTGEMIGVEALVRWQHPRLGLIPPDYFIPVAEETGLIIPIGNWVLRTACAQNKAWQDEGFPPIRIAVNISARQFQQGDLVATVKDTIEQTRLEPKYLELELTEGTLVQNVETAADALRRLKEMGVHASIDDFGTGYSSLSYLKRLPVSSVKIDRAFIRNINTNPDDAAIAGAVVAMAHSLRLKVTAEGVETLEQLEFLKSLNCDDMQGYFISEPVAAEELIQLLQKVDNEVMGELREAA